MTNTNVFYSDGSLYDQEYLGYTPDFAFVAQLIRENVPHNPEILELCAGTLRLTIPLVKALADISPRFTAVDLAPAMLEEGRNKLKNEPGYVKDSISLLQADMRNLPLREKYNFVYIPFNSFLHMMTPQDQQQTLAEVWRLLKPEGFFYLDLFHPDIKRLGLASTHPQSLTQERVVSLPDGRTLVRITVTSYHSSEQRYEHVFYYNFYSDRGLLLEQVRKTITQHVIFPAEAKLLLKEAGFKISAVYGDYAFNPLTNSSLKMLFLAQKL